MTTLIVLASIALLIVVAVQIGKISELSAKIRGEDLPKINKAISIVEENIDFELLCRAKK